VAELKIDIPINTAKRVQQFDRILYEQEQAIQYRLKGHTYEYISNKLGISAPTVSQRIKDAFRAAASNAYYDIDELRAVEHQRLEASMTVAIEIMQDPEIGPKTRLDAIDRVERISASIRKLFGADMPTRIEHTHSMTREERVERVRNTLGIEDQPTLEDAKRQKLVDLMEHEGMDYDEAREYIDAEFEPVED
jgi:DNA-binding Lrp family transcriptional regulator